MDVFQRDLVIVLSIFAVGAVVHFARKFGSAPKARNVSRPFAALEIATAPVPPAPAPPSANPVWVPLPGNWLALGATGFEIGFVPGDDKGVFHLHSPEGKVICFAHDVETLKTAGGNMANQREQFDVKFFSSEVLDKAAGKDSGSV